MAMRLRKLIGALMFACLAILTVTSVAATFSSQCPREPFHPPGQTVVQRRPAVGECAARHLVHFSRVPAVPRRSSAPRPTDGILPAALTAAAAALGFALPLMELATGNAPWPLLIEFVDWITH
jgi:hypothetical protein